MNSDHELENWMRARRQRIEAALDTALALPDAPASHRLLDAMRYATLGGGKRLRALLVYAAGESLGANPEALDAAACAVEMIHAYSLVHDDMPVMDNDDLRRGQPTCHKAFDESTALLAGDALQSLAFETLCADVLSAQQQAAMVRRLAHAAGASGMAGGQAVDLESVGRRLDLEQLQRMHCLKTGALIRASVALGALAADADNAVLDKLDRYADAIGLAFQVQDDVLDVTADTQTLGKTQGADIARNKPTYPALLGLKQAQRKAADLVDEAIDLVQSLPFDSPMLQALARYVVNRDY